MSPLLCAAVLHAQTLSHCRLLGRGKSRSRRSQPRCSWKFLFIGRRRLLDYLHRCVAITPWVKSAAVFATAPCQDAARCDRVALGRVAAERSASRTPQGRAKFACEWQSSNAMWKLSVLNCWCSSLSWVTEESEYKTGFVMSYIIITTKEEAIDENYMYSQPPSGDEVRVQQ